MTKPVLEQLRELDKQRLNLIKEAKAAALTAAQKAVAELNELGFDYKLLEPPAPKARNARGRTASPRGGRKGTRTIKDAPCPICQFQTKPPHDGRRHRMQGDDKRPFSDAELRELSYRRIQ